MHTYGVDQNNFWCCIVLLVVDLKPLNSSKLDDVCVDVCPSCRNVRSSFVHVILFFTLRVLVLRCRSPRLTASSVHNEYAQHVVNIIS